MPVSIPPNFPNGSTESELLDKLEELLREYVTWGGDDSHGANIVTAGDARISTVINAAQLELQKRLMDSNAITTAALHKEIVSLKKVTQQYSHSSKRFSVASSRLSIAAIIIALVTIFVSVVLAYQSDNSSKVMQYNQNKILIKIEHNTEK